MHPLCKTTLSAFLVLLACHTRSQDINPNRPPSDPNVPYNNYPYSSSPSPYSPDQYDQYSSPRPTGQFGQQYPDQYGSPRPTGQYGGGQYGQQFPDQTPRYPGDQGRVYGQTARPVWREDYGGGGGGGGFRNQFDEHSALIREP